MKSSWLTFLSAVIVMVSDASMSQAAIRTVSNSSELQSALNAAIAGDEIVLTNGTYTGQFVVNGNSGTASAPITLRAANRHQAILANAKGCGTTVGLNVLKNYWTIKDIYFRDHDYAVRVGISGIPVTGTEFANNIVENFGAGGIFLQEANNSRIHDNVLAFGDACQGYEDGGIWLWNASSNTIQNNIVFATGDNGTQSGNKNGYGLIIQTSGLYNGALSTNNLVQGNAFFMNGGKGQTRLFNTQSNTFRDNVALWGEGSGIASDDCSDDYNSFINNLLYGGYWSTFGTKGNDTGSRGHHAWTHNTFVINQFSMQGSVFVPNSDTCGGTKYHMTLRDNIIMAETPLGGGNLKLMLLSNQSIQFDVANNNLFWAPSAISGWTQGYTPGSNDIYSASFQPQFTNVAGGDFTLTSTSPGKGKASDGKDVGIEYNSFLKKSWVQNVFSLPTQQKTGISGTTTSFPVSANHYYAVWFHIPDNSGCYLNPERFTFGDGTVDRDMSTNGIRAGNDTSWIQPSGHPSRWITLGRHKASDGTLNISWTRADCADAFVIRQIPTTQEAYTWITGATVTPPQSPPSSPLAIPGKIEAEEFATGGEGVAYHDTTSANLEGAYRTNESVDVKLAPDGIGYTIGYIVAGEWLKYDVNVTQSANYTMSLRVANGATTNGALRVEVDGVNITGTISIPPTGSYSTETTVTGPTISLAQGAHTLRVYMEASDFDLNWIEFTPSSVGSAPATPGNLVVGIQ